MAAPWQSGGLPATPALDVLAPTTLAAGPHPAPRQADGARVSTAAVASLPPVIKKPLSSKLFEIVCHPDGTVLVIGNPRSSHAVTNSTPSEDGVEDDDGSRGGEEVDVEPGKV